MRDYTKRTSHMYDDRDGDTVTTLGSGIIKVCDYDNPPPKLAFFLVPQPGNSFVDDKTKKLMPCINLEIISFANMNLLSKELQQKIREELGIKATTRQEEIKEARNGA